MFSLKVLQTCSVFKPQSFPKPNQVVFIPKLQPKTTKVTTRLSCMSKTPKIQTLINDTQKKIKMHDTAREMVLKWRAPSNKIIFSYNLFVFAHYLYIKETWWH